MLSGREDKGDHQRGRNHGATTASSDMSGDKDSYEDDEGYVCEKRDPRHDAAPIAPCPGICTANLRHRQQPETNHAPCSTCGSSSVTAFSASVSPTRRVLGIGQKAASHHKGKRMKPAKKAHACSGDASSSSECMCKAHSVGWIFGGLRGSCMWY